jgi:hypothetical protein
MTSRSVEVDGSDSTPRTALGDGAAAVTAGGGDDGTAAVGAGAVTRAGGVAAGIDVAPGADPMGATVARETAVLPGDVAALKPIPSASAATVPPTSSGTNPTRPTGSRSRHRGQNPDTGVVVYPQFRHVTGRRAMRRGLHSSCEGGG